MSTEQRRYKIGLFSVYMTEKQAEYWADGETTEENMKGAIIVIPTLTKYGLPCSDDVDFWSKISDEEFYSEYLENVPAVLDEED